jgi:hypothetical protein
MKTIAIGDIHGRSIWLDILKKEMPDRVIFVGDYFDSFAIDINTQVENFNNIIKWKEDNPNTEVILLIGNHDIHYFREIGYCGTSGYQSHNKFILEHLIETHRGCLRMSYQFDDILITHAGVSKTFLYNNFNEIGQIDGIAERLNELFYYRPNKFLFNSEDVSFCDPYGDNPHQSPIWIRPKSLMADNRGTLLKSELRQIVGHTSFKTIDMGKSTGGRYYFIDVLDESSEYLIIQNGVISKSSLN